MKTKILKVKFQESLKDNMWTPEEYYEKFDTDKEYQLQKEAPLVYRVNGMFVSASYLEHNIMYWIDRVQYFQNKIIPEWRIVK